MSIVENLVSLLVVMIPLFALAIKYLDIRSAKRQEANNEFNSLLLWGVESIGNLTAANTNAITNGKAGKETEVAIAEYQRFHTAIEVFKNKQTARTL